MLHLNPTLNIDRSRVSQGEIPHIIFQFVSFKATDYTFNNRVSLNTRIKDIITGKISSFYVAYFYLPNFETRGQIYY